MNEENSSLRYVHDVDINNETSLGKLLSRIHEGAKVLEVGPASGAMTKVLANEKKCQVSIIEMDKECYDIAMQYAFDGVCCDFEEYGWKTSFETDSYDYVIFADVLEHLKNPLKAIEIAAIYLKDSGSLMISVPNIAHNSIIIQLINNQFIYNSTGILDHTHIKHFTFLELEKIYTEAGYKPVYLDATYVSVGKNEFDISYKDIDPLIEEVLRNRPFGEVYQHICELKKSEYYIQNALSTDNRIGGPIVYLEKDNSIEHEQNEEVKNVPNFVFETNKEIARLQLKINDLYNSIPYLDQVDKIKEQIFAYQEEVRQKNNHIRKLNKCVEKDNLEYKNRIEQLEIYNTEYVNYISELEKSNTELEKANTECKNRVMLLKDELCNKNEQIIGKNYEINEDRRLLEAKDIHIRNIEAERNNIAAQLQQKEIDILTLNHQINLKNNHIANIEYGYNKWLKFHNNILFRVIRSPKAVAKKVYHKMKEDEGIERLTIPTSSNPKVSIVIPVYNQFDYTHACIKSIINTVKDVSYEIIIGDDMSTDATKKIKKYISGVKVNINKTDHGFLMNCNRAAKLAKGEFIVFLNNDTQVHEEWLSSLVELIESDDKIGMVGSKLVYPDGSLQEAGGIIWSDASGWNYGRNQNADMPEYNYVRECDYISGASIMISKSLWDEIGGFDERFKPAYCEDSDLAFEVRKRGYKVMYQPKSVVTHFEGVSNGTELDSGLKKYQVENGKKFKEKWATELQSQYESGQVPFCARERNHGKKIILIIDHYVPTYDKDAGSKTTFQYIKMFLDKGYVVKFIGDNYAQMEPYTTTLQQLGVEVLYGPWYAEHIFEWIDANKEYISFAYLNRPHITEKYIDYIKENTDIKIIYYGHDLHFLRTEREYELEKDEKKLAESKMWKAKEFDILHKSDMNYYPSYVEEEAIHQIDADIPVKAITAYVFEKFIENYNYDVANRSGILFVGGFAHGPNIDAVNWFANEVYPIIREKNKNIDFYIVGSNAPEEIKQLNGNGIIFKGFVSDEELMELYSKCRIVVVPLRYGAGVKGKVVEAIYNGAPIVTTSVGAEGIAGVEDVLKIEDEAEAFANTVVDLYSDEDALVELANKTQSFIKENFSIDAVWNIIKEDFE